jgi:hypothetical protein
MEGFWRDGGSEEVQEVLKWRMRRWAGLEVDGFR